MNKIARISGAVGPKVLAKADQLFTQADSTVFAELLQNSRRAGATKVDFILEPLPDGCSITMADDGGGIENFQNLVTFGDSNWDEALDEREAAAGMGFFSLASRGVTVRSRGEIVRLTKDVFLGRETAAVLPDPAPVSVGVTLHFNSKNIAGSLEHVSPASYSTDPVIKQIARAAFYYPVKVTINSQALPQVGFLDDALAVTQWSGIKIGVFNASKRLYAAGNSSSDFAGTINFHGHTVRAAAPAATFTIGQVHGEDLTVAFEVVDAPELKLVLPTRDVAVQNEFMARLATEGRRAIYRYLAGQGRHSLPYTKWQEAATLGVELPPAEIHLETWSPVTEDGWIDRRVSVHIGSDADAIVCGLDRPDGHILAQVVGGDASARPIFVARNQYAGYPQYDRLQHIVGFRHVVTVGGLETVFDDADGGDGLSGTDITVVDSIVTTVLAERKEPGDLESVASILWTGPVSVIYGPDADYWDNDYVVAKGSDPNSVVGILMTALFSPSDDVEADSWEKQREDAWRYGIEEARRRLLGDVDAAVGALFDHLSSHGYLFRFGGLKGLTIVPVKTERGVTLTASVALEDGPPRTIEF